MKGEIEIKSDWRTRLTLPSQDHSSGVVNVDRDTTTGLHAHIQGVHIAQEVLRVKDLLEAHYIFGSARNKAASGSSKPVDKPILSTAEILVMEHGEVVKNLYDLVPALERTSAVFARIHTDPPFARHALCGAVSMNYLSDHDQGRLHDYIEQLSSLATRYKTFALTRDLFIESAVGHSREDDFHKLRGEHRRLFIEIASFFEAGNWFSPSQFSSIVGVKGVHQPAVRLGSDYGRSYPELLHILESRFSEERGLPRGRSSLSLTGSGLQALNTAIGVVEKVAARQPPRPVLAQSGIYWECDQRLHGLLSSRWVSEVSSSPIHSAQELVAQILEKKPRLVVAAPIGNSPEMPVINVPELLAALSSPQFASAWHGIAGQHHPGELIVLLDNTVLSGAARWTNFNFSLLPQWCILGSIESMIKLRQDGFDSAPSGSLTWYGSERIVEWLHVETALVRASFGYTPPPSTLFKLMLAPTHEYSIFRTEQHFLNSRVLIAGLRGIEGLGEQSTDGPPPIRLELVTPLKEFHSRRPFSSLLDDRDSPIFFIKVNNTSVEAWQRYFAQRDGKVMDANAIRERILSLFLSSVLDEARASGVNIHEGTSFGFDETRVSLIGTDAIRVAPGIEHLEKIKVIKNLFLTSAALLSQRILNADLFQLEKEARMRFPRPLNAQSNA